MHPAEVIAALPGPVLVIGPHSRIEAANTPAEALVGGPLVGKHYVTVLRQPDIVDAIEATASDGTARSSRFLGRRQATDTTWHVSVRRAGSHVVIAFEDRTAAEEASQIRRDFVANVSHELKTPLTALIGFIETLRGPARDDDAARARFLGILEREAQRMNRLVSDLLSLSRVEADARMRPRTPVDVGATLTSVVMLLRSVAEDRGVTVQYDPPDHPVIVQGDADQLRQVFANLLENAIKYGGKQVQLRLTERDHIPDLRRAGVVIEVADDGTGIDSRHLPRLTERFYRVDTHRSREVGGTGLGLAIVKHIVSRHRGRLRITSTPGRGSTFVVNLPIEI